MAQSRKTQVICIGLSKELRLIARSRSYRVQIKVRYIPKEAAIGWHDVQIIPRTQRREDIPSERVTAEAAFRRREQEYQGWLMLNISPIKVQHITNRMVASGLYKGSQTWTAILSEIDHEFVKLKIVEKWLSQAAVRLWGDVQGNLTLHNYGEDTTIMK